MHPESEAEESAGGDGAATGGDFTLGWSAQTDVGRFRKNNEDAFLLLAIDSEGGRYLGKTGQATLGACDFVFAVCDGMGGALAGEFSSKIAAEKITQLLPRSFRAAALGLPRGFDDILVDLFGRIHHSIQHLGDAYDECRGMGTTLSLGWFTPGHLHFCHIGDSRIYYLPRGGELLQLTDDHSHVGWLRRAGRLNEREARTHPGRSSLQQALGAGNQVIEPQVGRVRLAPGDRFLFCSDGLIEGLWDFRLADMLARDPEAAMEPTLGAELVEMAVAASGRDNTTAIVVEAFRQG